MARYRRSPTYRRWDGNRPTSRSTASNPKAGAIRPQPPGHKWHRLLGRQSTGSKRLPTVRGGVRRLTAALAALVLIALSVWVFAAGVAGSGPATVGSPTGPTGAWAPTGSLQTPRAAHTA